MFLHMQASILSLAVSWLISVIWVIGVTALLESASILHMRLRELVDRIILESGFLRRGIRSMDIPMLAVTSVEAFR
jgi:hypothetical protein